VFEGSPALIANAPHARHSPPNQRPPEKAAPTPLPRSIQRCFMDANLPLIASMTAPRSSLTATGGLARVQARPARSFEW